jgi:hypothetical protein
MEPEGSLPHSQEAATCPYPEPYMPNAILNIMTSKLHYFRVFFFSITVTVFLCIEFCSVKLLETITFVLFI